MRQRPDLVWTQLVIFGLEAVVVLWRFAEMCSMEMLAVS